MPHDPRYRQHWPVGFLALFLRGRGVWSSCLTGVAILLLSGLSWNAFQVDRFNARADKTTATVARLSGDQALVRYETPQGSFAQRIAAGRLAPGDRLQVYYVPEAPAAIRRTLRRDLAGAGVIQLFATGVGLVALWLGWGHGLQTIRMLQTRQYGALEKVTVTRIEASLLTQNSKDPLARLHWKQSDGTFGASLWQSKVHLAQWQPDDLTDIYVWRDHALWHDDLGPRSTLRSRIPLIRRSGQDPTEG